MDSAFPFTFWCDTVPTLFARVGCINSVRHLMLLSACRLPGIISSLALVLMNLVSRDDLAAMQDYYSGEDHAEVRLVRHTYISLLLQHASWYCRCLCGNFSLIVPEL